MGRKAFTSNVSDFSCRNKVITAKPLMQSYRCHKLRKTFSKFYRRQSGLVEKYNVSLRKRLQYRNHNSMVTWFTEFEKKNVGKSNFAEQLKKTYKQS